MGRPGWRGVLREAVLVGAVAAFQLLGTYAAAKHQSSARSLDVGSTLLLLAGPAVLPLRRRAPWVTIAVALLAAVAYFSIGYPGGPVFASVVVALIVMRRERHVQARAARQREEAVRRDEERLRIARELHDVLAHSTAIVSVQAGVALHLMDTHPEQVRGSLEAIRDASADSLRELRAAVDLLRTDPADGAEPAERAPQPGLAGLQSLAASAQSAGVEVQRQTEGSPRQLRAEVDLAAYRIIQESLTNAARHAGPGVVDVTMRYEDDALVLQIDSHGRSAAAPSSGPASEPGGGRGLIGMRERAHALGGSLRAGPRAAGGFRVHARLPYEATR